MPKTIGTGASQSQSSESSTESFYKHYYIAAFRFSNVYPKNPNRKCKSDLSQSHIVIKVHNKPKKLTNMKSVFMCYRLNLLHSFAENIENLFGKPGKVQKSRPLGPSSSFKVQNFETDEKNGSHLLLLLLLLLHLLLLLLLLLLRLVRLLRSIIFFNALAHLHS
jgi:hypothetical protein